MATLAPARELRQSRIVTRLLEITSFMRTRYEQVAADHGLTQAQASALLALAEPTPMRELAGALRCDASNITGLADRLARRGLLRRVESPADRRVKLLVLTDAGLAMRDELRRDLLADHRGLGVLKADEQRTLLDLLDRMAISMADVADEHVEPRHAHVAT